MVRKILYKKKGYVNRTITFINRLNDKRMSIVKKSNNFVCDNYKIKIKLVRLHGP